jgi:hypothetical protein
MEFYITILIFLSIIFLYIHMMAQYKKSEDLEIYEMDYTTNQNLQETCSVKQPVLFNFKTVNPDIFTDLDNSTFLKYESYDIKVRDTDDFLSGSNNSADPVSLKYDSFRRLAAADSRSHFITEGNLEFIEKSGLYSEYEELNPYLKPSLTVQTKYDLLQGSEGAYTPLRYHIDERQYFIVSSGKITVKMTPFKSRKYLHPIMDYSNYEFRSPIDAWKPENNQKYTHDIEKIKYLEFEVLEGFVLYIPPYWWYSIKYSSAESIVLGATYNSVPRVLANSWDILQYYLQQDNTTSKVARTIQIPTEEVTKIEETEPIINPLEYVE